MFVAGRSDHKSVGGRPRKALTVSNETIKDLENYLDKRLPQETAKQFDYFCEFLRQGADRSISNVARTKGKTYILMAKYAKKNKWHDRARLYDSKLQQAEIEAKMEQRKKFITQQEETARELHNIGKESLKKLETFINSEPDLAGLRPMEILQFIKTGIELERIVMGLDKEKEAKTNNKIQITYNIVNDKNPHKDLFNNLVETKSEVVEDNGKDTDADGTAENGN